MKRGGGRCVRAAPRGGYTDAVRSVADDLRLRTVHRVLELPVRERLRVALALGDDDLALFLRSSGLDRDQARERLRAQRARGRTPSRVATGATP